VSERSRRDNYKWLFVHLNLKPICQYFHYFGWARDKTLFRTGVGLVAIIFRQTLRRRF